MMFPTTFHNLTEWSHKPPISRELPIYPSFCRSKGKSLLAAQVFDKWMNTSLLLFPKPGLPFTKFLFDVAKWLQKKTRKLHTKMLTVVITAVMLQMIFIFFSLLSHFKIFLQWICVTCGKEEKQRFLQWLFSKGAPKSPCISLPFIAQSLIL